MARNIVVSLALLALVVLAGAGAQSRTRTAAAANFAVINTNDSGPGSLRAAIDAANAAPGPDTITFAIDGTISVTNSLNIQDEGTTIDATGHAIVVDGSLAPAPNNIIQVIASSATFIGFTVQNAMNNGISVSPAFNGGCVGSITTVSLARMTVSGNGDSGLLICAASGGQALISDSDFLGNTTGITASGAIADRVEAVSSRFVGNELAIHVQGAVTGTLNATTNWWGCPTGANTSGCDSTHPAVDTSNPTTVDSFRVTNLNDSGEGSLRRAINYANSRPGHDVIRFDVSGTIALTGGGFPVTDNLDIDGAGQAITIDGAAMPSPSNIFEATSSSFALRDVTVRNAPSNAVSLGSGACPPDLGGVIERVRFEGSGESGLLICGSGSIGVQVAESEFIGNQTGVTVIAGTNADGVQVVESSFVGQTGMAVSNDSATGTVNAQGNWWGCNAGANGPDPACESTLGSVDASSPVANVFVVENLDDSGEGSLRHALQLANADPDPNTINFVVSGAIVLESTLFVSTDVVIDGIGVDITLDAEAIPGSGNPAIFVEYQRGVIKNLDIVGAEGGGIYVNPGSSCLSPVAGVEIEGVSVSGAGGNNAGILLCGSDVSQVSISNTSVATATDAIRITGPEVADIVITNATIESEAVALLIGGSQFSSVERIEIQASTVRNTAGSNGGVVVSAGFIRDVRLDDTTLQGNAAFVANSLGAIDYAGIAIVDSAITGGVFVRSNGGGSVSDVSITGNSVVNPYPTAAVWIQAPDVTDIAVEDNLAIVRTAPTGPAVFIEAIGVVSSITNVRVSGNGTISGTGHGVLVGKQSNSPVMISDITIDRNGSISGSAQSGVSVFGLGGATISGIRIQQNGSITGGGTRAIGIGSVTASAVISDVSISDNQALSGFDAGISIGNQAATASNSGLVLTGNGLITASGPGAPAIQILSGNPGAGNVVSANGIADSAVGVRVANAVPGVPTGLTIVGNVIENTGAGVRVESGAGNGLVVRLNNFLGNTLGIDSLDAVAAIDAAQNWWGCAAGPGTASCDSLAVTAPGSITFTPWLEAPVDVVRTSPAASGGESAAVAGVPSANGQSGAAATIQTTGSVPVTVTVSTYLSNPASTLFDVGGGFVDVFLNEPASVTSVSSVFYYPASVTGAAEASLVLWYFDGESWLEVRGSGGVIPAKDTTDNLDGTVSGGRFQLVFDSTSTPTAGELNGTILTFTSRPPSIDKIKLTDGKKVGKKVKLAATFEDSTPAAVYVATIDWGDGTVTPADVDIKLNHGVAKVTVKKEDHVYSAPGDYTVTLTLRADGRTLVVAMGTVEVRP